MKELIKHIQESFDNTDNEVVIDNSFVSESVEQMNEGANDPLSDISKLHTLEPIKIRRALVKLLKMFYEKQGWDKSSPKAYNDIDVVSIKGYPKHILRNEFRNNKKAVELFSPMLKASDKLYDFNTEYIKVHNALFAEYSKIGKAEILNAVEDTNIQSILRNQLDDEGDAVSVFVFLSESDFAEVGFRMYSEKEIIKALKPLKKILNDYEIKSVRDGFALSGSLKSFDKATKKLRADWVKKVIKSGK
ncbi:hypothetical protein HYO65_gp188 [Tenacibaculum phage PTm1]|uniref:Uncharacterized protein n=2 Tax=Shirahamavirus PTm1 TaxID=2846435 RepID=A0A5S9HXB4_9CAUD|nr:hypothetical protein HYO65_gp188 [Tenacibaculum phage PTm1]BBI90580.1 hypothetical protein [Tenacibaculum phage PTm1]BBI90888.1 hypothetical protein [Tenacibaculum phage PTm5]